MPMSPAARRSVALYRRLLLVYPPSFRRRNRERMVETFAEMCAAAQAERGAIGTSVLWAHTLIDLARNGIAARRAPRSNSPAPRGGSLMEDLLADIRYALRTLRRSPGFAAVAIVTMALGVGVNAAMFSFVDAVVLQPLPFPEPERLVQVFETYQGEELERRAVGYPTLRDWRERIDAFAGIAALTAGDVALTEQGEAQRFIAQLVDPQLFELLGAVPAIGRGLVADDNLAHEQEPVAVLGHELWQTAFGGRDDIVGETIRLNGIATTVVGIMPPAFTGPFGNARIWLPIRPGMRVTQAAADVLESRGNRGLGALARLSPGATLQSAQAELDAMTLTLREEHPDSYVDRGALVVSLEEQLLGATRDPVLLLMGAVGLVLLIASANLANLTLARAVGRREEIAMRFALGAGRARMVRQLLTESTVLALLGGGVGLLLATWSINGLITLLPFNVPEYVEVGINGSVVLFTLGVTLVTGVIFGLFPALTASGRFLSRNLSSARGGSGRSRRLAGLDARGLLVAAEIALSLTLLVGAALLVQSFAGMRMIEPGFEAAGLLSATVELPASRYDAEQIAVFRDELQRGLRGTPGVQAAALASDLPLAGGYSAIVMADEEGVTATPPETVRVYRHSISPGWIEAIGAELVAGRGFEPTDTGEAPAVMLVSETMAARTWPGQDAVGQRLTRNGNDWITVVGVLRDIRHRQIVVDTFVNPDDPDVYFPLAQAGSRTLVMLARTAGDPVTLLEPLRAQVRRMDADLPVYDATTLREVVDGQLAVNRASAQMLTGFGGLALLLAAVGIYGVMAAAVSARGREIGIRLALGAGRPQVVGVVLRQGLTMALIGIALGIAAAVAASRLLESLLFGVSATDPGTMAAVAGVLLAATVAASLVPLRRALAVDPARALRGE